MQMFRNCSRGSATVLLQVCVRFRNECMFRLSYFSKRPRDAPCGLWRSSGSPQPSGMRSSLSQGGLPGLIDELSVPWTGRPLHVPATHGHAWECWSPSRSPAESVASMICPLSLSPPSLSSPFSQTLSLLESNPYLPLASNEALK